MSRVSLYTGEIRAFQKMIYLILRLIFDMPTES